MNWHFLLSRRLPHTLLAVVTIELTLPLWAAPALKIAHDGHLRVVPLAVPAQIIIVALLLYTVSSAFHALERQAARSMRIEQAALWLIIAPPVLASTLVASILIGDSGNLGTLAPLKAVIGMWGIGLASSGIIDRRLAGVIPALALVLPALVSPSALAGSDAWGFAFAPDDSPVAWLTACGALAVGVAVHIFMATGKRR